MSVYTTANEALEVLRFAAHGGTPLMLHVSDEEAPALRDKFKAALLDHDEPVLMIEDPHAPVTDFYPECRINTSIVKAELLGRGDELPKDRPLALFVVTKAQYDRRNGSGDRLINGMMLNRAIHVQVQG